MLAGARHLTRTGRLSYGLRAAISSCNDINGSRRIDTMLLFEVRNVFLKQSGTEGAAWAATKREGEIICSNTRLREFSKQRKLWRYNSVCVEQQGRNRVEFGKT